MNASRPTTILCIDDDVETLKSRSLLLKIHGYRVITALSGADGLQMLSEGQSVDLVLLDYMMTGMTGEQVAKELKHTHPAVPVVLVSGFPDVPQTLLTIVDGFVQKGKEPELIIGAIASALARNR
jgi:CheY-like chemotaxis protein